MELEQEQRTFVARLPELRAGHEGEFAFILGKDVLGVFPTYKEAIRAGKERVGVETPFFVGWIVPENRREVFLTSFVVVTEPDEAREELEKKEREAMRAQIREEYGSVEAFVLEAIGLGPTSSRQT